MCGLCGSFTQKGTQLVKRDRVQRARALEGLLIANQVRGTDSTGIAAIGFDGSHEIIKNVSPSPTFVNKEDVQALLRKPNDIVIGHTRMTSMGNDVRDENAHPFKEGTVIGAHNGVISNYLELDHTVRVDSQAVIRMLDEMPDAYDHVFQQVSGSCAMTWWDEREPEAMYIVAHSNPLAAAIVPRIKTVFWSSILEHLEAVMHAAYGSEVVFMQVKQDHVYRLDASDVYAWQEHEVDFGKDAYSRYTKQVRVYSHGGYGWDDDYQGGTNAGPKASASSSTANSTPAMSKEEEERYETYWERMMAEDQASESESAFGSKPESNVERLHDLTGADFEEYEANRFEVQDIEGDMMCDYCEKPLGEKGAWDSGLTMMLCRPCQTWWDTYGHYVAKGKGSEEKYPIAVYTSPQA